jgi:hypothetical protein
MAADTIRRLAPRAITRDGRKDWSVLDDDELVELGAALTP